MSSDNRRILRVALLALACLLLTGALGSLMIYADASLDGLLDRHFEPGVALVFALLIGFLVGVMIEDARILFPLIALMCIGAALLYVGIILAPTWEGSIVRTTGLENFATTRAVLYFGLSFPPTAGGALIGRLLGELLPGGEFLPGPPEDGEHEFWFDQRRRATTEPEGDEDSNLAPDSPQHNRTTH